MKIKDLKSRFDAQLIIAAAILDDIIALVLLSELEVSPAPRSLGVPTYLPVFASFLYCITLKPKVE